MVKTYLDLTDNIHCSQGLWDDPTEALEDDGAGLAAAAAAVPTAPPHYSAENDCDDLPPSYEECVRLGMAD